MNETPSSVREARPDHPLPYSSGDEGDEPSRIIRDRSGSVGTRRRGRRSAAGAERRTIRPQGTRRDREDSSIRAFRSSTPASLEGEGREPRNPSGTSDGRPATGGAARVAGDAAWLIGTAYAAQVVTLVLSLALRRVLGPDGMGYIALTQLAATYAPFLGLGSMQAAEREIAIDLGRGAVETAERLERTAATLVLAAGVLVVAIAFGAASGLAGQPVDVWTIRVAGAIVLFQQLAIWATVRMRTRYRFRPYGIWSAAGGVAMIALTLVGAALGGTLGALAGAAAGSFIQALALVRVSGIRARLGIERVSLRRLARLSPSFLAVGLSAVLLASIDQLAVATFLGASALGLYSAAYLGNLFLMRVPNLIGSVIYPRLQRDLGAHADPRRVFALARRTTDTTLVLLPLLVAGLFVGLPIVIRLFLPSFVAAIPAMRLLLVGVTGLALAIPATQCLITLDLQWRAVVVTFGFAAAMWAAYFAADQAGMMSITTAAAVDVVAYAGYGTASQAIATRSVGVDARWILGAAVIAAVPMAALLVGAGLAGAVLDESGALGMFVGAVIQGTAFGLAWLAAASLSRRLSPTVASDTAIVVHTVRAGMARVGSIGRVARGA